jgi:hypothetical protein
MRDGRWYRKMMMMRREEKENKRGRKEVLATRNCVASLGSGAMKVHGTLVYTNRYRRQEGKQAHV